ncbi:short-chain specific acyl-CoA dehydrogenase, mitochondrial-like [Toxorhynchites rutilus septentrionalis]|uniref:short-chain specific acyl-CoA dehydrogenase, mitochondrial-like n=1 Tax=Toxorhynchites rutilus septentrionalis TaxID=329112 RepID=UPI0024787387|nr:short-chain specific acyl-CoA dehydrogenase, mitochondrial-like [Toxorhynchites rutilus septentrionalis]
MFRRIFSGKVQGYFIRQFSVCELPQELQDIQKTCRNFANRELKPVAAALDANSRFPAEQMKNLADLGLMRVTVDTEYGGSNLNMLALSLVVEELSSGCGATGSIVSIHNCLYADMLNRLGTKQQKELFFGKYPRETIGVFALSESDAGSDVAALDTMAVKEGDCWILNGTKAWVTSAAEAKSGIVFATVDSELKHKGITAFLLDFDQAAGLKVGNPEDKLGIRASSTCSLYLENVHIPVKNVLGPIGGGFRIAMEQLDRARIGIASQALGIAQAALETAVQYAKQRKAFGQSLLELSPVRMRIAEMAVRIESARLLVRKAACEIDRNGRATKACSMAKWIASETATFAAHNCQQILGGMGYVKNMPAERYYRDARITEIYGGVTDVQKAVIAELTIGEMNA